MCRWAFKLTCLDSLMHVWCVGPKQSGVTVFSKLRKWKRTLIIHDIKQGSEWAHLQLNAGGNGDSSLFSMCLGNGVGEGWRRESTSGPQLVCHSLNLLPAAITSGRLSQDQGLNSLSLSEVSELDCTHERILWHVSDFSSIWTKHVRLLMCFFHVHWFAY